eukprot:TRINITY_DN1959_c0_g2_i2.p2 TRINITY_DN1959_c0_g2~~TRINITY_DN1959_c0_g2_i2.p2  ORF type:complete len:295 (+),score=49.41 TRINITY_DN1959_c0_g2_i2:1605-2489(+)
MLFGQSKFHRDGMIGEIFVFLTHTLPLFGKKVAVKIIGLKTFDRMVFLQNYCFFRRNPFLQIFYLGIVLSCLGVVLYCAFPILPLHHKIGCWTTIGIVFFVFYKASTSDPGVITPDNIEQFRYNYRYDGVIYRKKFCKTCKIVRPARSKHCGICNKCVSRFDHHCPWINTCVGANNLKWFLSFLLSTGLMCFYCSIGVVEIYYKTVMKFSLYKLPLPITFQYLVVYRGPGLMGLLLFTFLAGCAVWLFLLYHCYLIARNKTTNEGFKYSVAKEMHQYNITVLKEKPKRKKCCIC